MKSFALMILAIILIVILSMPALVLNTIRKVYRSETIEDYFYVVALGFDQLGGSLLYGQEDWTVSSWTYHLAINKQNYNAVQFMTLIDFFFGKNHCQNSFIKEADQLNFKVK